MVFHLWFPSDVVSGWAGCLPPAVLFVSEISVFSHLSLPTDGGYLLLLALTLFCQEPLPWEHRWTEKPCVCSLGPPSRACWWEVLLCQHCRLWGVFMVFALLQRWAPSGWEGRWVVQDSGLPATTTGWQIPKNLFIASCYKVVHNIPLLKLSSSYRNIQLWPTVLLTFPSTDTPDSMNLLCFSLGELLFSWLANSRSKLL